MSRRGMVRAGRRAAAARARRRARRVGVGAAVVLTSSAAAAPSASAFVVTTLSDSGDNVCDSNCTLRDAIDDSIDNGVGFDRITFQSGLTGTLTLTQAHSLDIYGQVSIEGPGADKLTVKATNSRVFYAVDGYSTIAGMTLTGGNGKQFPASTSKGGAVYIGEPGGMTFDHVVITGNSATSHGGGIDSYNSDITVTNSTITGNKAGGNGAGIYMEGVGRHKLLVRNSTISDNTGYAAGAGIATHSVRTVAIDHSTVSGNVAPNIATGSAGGVYAMNTIDAISIEDTTISNNAAAYYGGAFYADRAPGGITIRNSTIAGNASRYGGAVSRTHDPMTISSSILADNSPQDLINPPLSSYSPPVNLSFSLVENAGTTPLYQSPAGSNVIGADPQLSPLADNGGPTKTQLIAPTSLAVDAGVANNLGTDQRGLARTSERVGVNPTGSDGTDMGAVELPGSTGSTRVDASPTQRIQGTRLSVVVDLKLAEDFGIDATGAITYGAGKKKVHRRGLKAKSVALGDVHTTGSAGTTVSLTLVPARKSAARKIAKRLARGGSATASIDVVLTDFRGAETKVPVTVKLKGAKRKHGKHGKH